MPARSHGTTRQILTNVWPVAFRLTPTYHLPDASGITPAFLDAEGIDLVIWDVDGTLMSYHAKRVASPLVATLSEVTRNPHHRHFILSKCDEQRFETLGEIFPSLPLFRGYVLDDKWVSRVRRGTLDTHSRDAVRELLQRGGWQVRKPDARLVPAIMEEAGVRDPQRTLVVGDQFLTDVATAHLAGARSAKVDTLEPASFPRSIQTTQRIERTFYRLTNRPRA
jgi:predicted HAD superfamily phosphohydrolase YqeG